MFHNLFIALFLFFIRSKFIESFPRLDPPPPVLKKRVLRALKTTQDMIISPNPVLSSPEKTVISPEVSVNVADEMPVETAIVEDDLPTLKGQPDSLLNGKVEDIVADQTAMHNGSLPEIARSVPDIIHKESLDTNLRENSHFQEKVMVKLCISQEDLSEDDINRSDWSSWPKNSTLDSDGPHPDLLSFE